MGSGTTARAHPINLRKSTIAIVSPDTYVIPRTVFALQLSIGWILWSITASWHQAIQRKLENERGAFVASSVCPLAMLQAKPE